MLRLRTLGISEILIGQRTMGPERSGAFVLLLLAALRAPRAVSRLELAELLWPDTAAGARSHRMRSLLHRIRRMDAPLECSETAVRLAAPVVLDFRDLSTPPGAVDDVRHHVADVGPILPGLCAPPGTPLDERLDDERDAIRGTVMRWVTTALDVAKRAGDWPLVEQVARAGRAADPFNEEAWLSLAEAQCLTASKARALRTLDEYVAGLGDHDEPLMLPAELLRRRVGEAGPSRHVPDGGRGDTPVRIIRFTASPRHAQRAGAFVMEMIAPLLDAPGAAGCDPVAYARLRAAGEWMPNGDGAAHDDGLPELLGDSFLELLAALTDESALVIVVESAQWLDVNASAFWGRVLEWSRSRCLAWLFVSDFAGRGAQAEPAMAGVAVSPPLRRRSGRP